MIFSRILGAVFLALAAGQSSAPRTAPATQPAHDWPMWGGTPARNPVASAAAAGRGLPAEWDVETKQNIKWSAPLGSTSYGGPVVAGGKVLVGTNNAGEYRPHSQGDKGCVLCFDAANGKLLWQATHDKLASGPANDWPEQGIASTPCVDGDRVYYVSNRCELVCADLAGFRDGENDGPYKDEKHTDPEDADFVWILDMIGTLGVFPHNLAACAPVGAAVQNAECRIQNAECRKQNPDRAGDVRDLVFVCTSNGVDEEHAKPPAPDAPSFIAVNKKTGAVVWKRNDPGERIFHGQWSSPAYGVIAGTPQVVFGGGDGWCYAFAPATGELLWKFNLSPAGTQWEPGGAGQATSIVATPVIVTDEVAGGRVYLAVGDDPENQRGPGHLYAIDATKRGDITESGRIWHFGAGGVAVGQVEPPSASQPVGTYPAARPALPSGDKATKTAGRGDFGRTLSSVAVADGVVYAADLDGFLYCLDAHTGQRIWKYDMQAAVWGSPLVADGKVFLGNADGELVVLEHAPRDTQPKEPKELARNDLRSPIYATPAVAGGVLYVLTQKTLYAIGK
ncbi:MAG: PQQ-binding-like beta-propeller repeat protein [Planctomycetota bacterium]